MKSDSPVNPSPVYPSTATRLQALLDDLRLIHRAETCRIGGREVDVCSTCRPEVSGTDLEVATSGRELYPCPTIRLTRRHARMAGAAVR